MKAKPKIRKDDIYAVAISVEEPENQPGPFTERRQAMKTQMESLGIQFEAVMFPKANFGTEENDKYQREIEITTKSTIEILRNVKELRSRHSRKYFLVLEDDAELHPDFVSEFQQTIEELPIGWRVLHLCPGFSIVGTIKTSQTLFPYTILKKK